MFAMKRHGSARRISSSGDQFQSIGCCSSSSWTPLPFLKTQLTMKTSHLDDSLPPPSHPPLVLSNPPPLCFNLPPPSLLLQTSPIYSVPPPMYSSQPPFHHQPQPSPILRSCVVGTSKELAVSSGGISVLCLVMVRKLRASNTTLVDTVVCEEITQVML